MLDGLSQMICHSGVSIPFSKMYICWFVFHNMYHVISSIQGIDADWDVQDLWENSIQTGRRIKGICFTHIRTLLWNQIRTRLVNCVLYKYVYFLWKLGNDTDFFFHKTLPSYLGVVDIKSVTCELQIIHLNLTQENPQQLLPGSRLKFTYSVKWVETNITFPRRFDIYLDHPFFEHQV